MDRLIDLAIYFANGLLTILYWLIDTAPQWTAVGMAVFLILTVDRWAQQQAVYAPDRYSTQALAVKAPRTAQIISIIVLLLWLTATWSFGPPVPLIGAVMWGVGVLAVLVMPQQRWSLLWTTKAGLALYSLAILGYRLYLWQTSRLSTAQLAEVFGGRASASQILAQNTGTFATVGAWLLWAVLPTGYIGVLVQSWAARPLSLISPLAGIRDILTAIRTRGS